MLPDFPEVPFENSLAEEMEALLGKLERSGDPPRRASSATQISVACVARRSGLS